MTARRTASSEEHPQRIRARIGLVGFGRTDRSTGGDDFDRDQSAWNAGTDLLHVVPSMFGPRIGLDIARGPEEIASHDPSENARIGP